MTTPRLEDLDTTLDLTNPEDRETYQRLLLFRAYLKDRGIAAQLILVVARDIGSTSVKVKPSDDAGDVIRRALGDIDDSNLEVTLAQGLNAIAGLVGGIFGATTPEQEAPNLEPTPSVTYDLKKTAESAISLELLARYASMLPATIFPREAIPTIEFIARCLKIFHALVRAHAEKQAADSLPALDGEVVTKTNES